jgi:hemolysin activation/secretion protein
MTLGKSNYMNRFKTILLSAPALLLAINSAQSQDFDKIAPKRPVRDASAVTLPDMNIQTRGSDKVLVDQLAGIVFVRGMEEVKRGGMPGITGVRAIGIPILNARDFKSRAQTYLGKPVSMQLLQEITRDVILTYRENELPLVNVIIPEQDITSGVVQIVVMTGKVGDVKVEGNRHFSTRLIRENVRLRGGDTVEAKTLIQDLNWLNSNPFREVGLVFTPGARRGETDIILRVNDRPPLRPYLGYEDTGNDLTGDERLVMGFNWGNAWGVDHQFNYQFTSDADFDKFLAHSASYMAPLPWRHRLSLFGSHVDTSADLAGTGFDLSGSSDQASLRYSIPLASLGDYVNALPLVKDYIPRIMKDYLPALPVLRDYVHEVVLGFDYKSSNNNLEFGGTQVFNQQTDILQGLAGYNSALKDPWGATSFGISWYLSPGDWTDNNTDVAFQGSRARADADYIYERASLERVTRLPYDFSWIVKATQQWSPTDTSLLGSEQLGFGGFNTVRGFDERDANGDQGYMFSTEIRTPSRSIAGYWMENARDMVQLLGFWDYGVAQNNNLLPGEDPNVVLMSAGPGIRVSWNPYFSMRADYGFQLKDDSNNARFSSRLHLGVLLSY